MRVVSLLPSATEIIDALGGRSLLVGRSHECDLPPHIPVPGAASATQHPPAERSPALGIDHLPVLTAARTTYVSAAQVDRDVRRALASSSDGTNAAPTLYSLDADLLARLRPDVILTQDLCHVCSIDLAAVRRVAESLSPRPQVVSLNPMTVEGVLDDVLTVGRAVGLLPQAEALVVRLRERMYAAQECVNPYDDGPSVAFIEWTDPIFVGGHWTPQLIERAGARHPLNPTIPIPASGAAAGPIGVTLRAAPPSRVVTLDDLLASRPDAVIVCPCGLTLDQTKAEFARSPLRDALEQLTPRPRLALVDGNQMFNRPGPRLVDALEWLVGWLHERPDLVPAGFPWLEWKGIQSD